MFTRCGFKYSNRKQLSRPIAAVVCLFCLLGSAAVADTITRIRGDRYEGQTVNKVLDLRGTENLEFTSSSYLIGSLTIRAVNRDDLSITYKKQFKAESQEMAEEFADYVSLSFEDLENQLSISAETRSSPPWRGTDFSAGVSLEIEAPRAASLKIFARTSLFNIDIVGPFAAVDISSNFGDIAIRNISNKVNVSAENGSVTVEDCTGPLKVTTTNRPISLRNIDAQLGTIRLRNENGRIEIDSVRGEIDARTTLTQISATRMLCASGRSTLSTENSNIRLNVAFLDGDLVIRNENGKVDVTLPETIATGILLQVEEGGRIYTRDLPIKVDQISRTILQGTIGNSRNRLEIDMAGVGTITVEGSASH